MSSGSAIVTPTTSIRNSALGVNDNISIAGAGAGGAALVTTVSSINYSANTFTTAASAATTVSAAAVNYVGCTFVESNSPSLMGTGTANNFTFLRGDGTWATPPASSVPTYGAGFIAQVGLGASSSFTGFGDYFGNGGTSFSLVNAAANSPFAAESTSLATTGSIAGFHGQSVARGQSWPVDTFGVEYSASSDYSSNARIFLGLMNTSCTTATLMASDTPACAMAMIRYSTVAGDTGYQCVAGSGSATTVTPIAVAPTTAFTWMSINMTASGVTCTVAGTSVTVSSTLPPVSGSNVYEPVYYNATQTAAATHLILSGELLTAQNGTY
jgi:hypothetical protein